MDIIATKDIEMDKEYTAHFMLNRQPTSLLPPDLVCFRKRGTSLKWVTNGIRVVRCITAFRAQHFFS